MHDLRRPVRCTSATSRDEALNASVTASANWNVSDQIRNTTQVRYLYENDDYHYMRTYGYGFAVGSVPMFDEHRSGQHHGELVRCRRFVRTATS